MAIGLLHITHLRNILNASINCSPKFNLFYGDNAAGKTSVLEAIYYLSTGKSFRTHHHDRVIHHTEDQMTLFARLTSHSNEMPVGLQRLRDGSIQVRINDETVRSPADISHHLPVQFIGSNSHRILSDGPKPRRQFLDWGLFYTNPAFYPVWKSFHKALAHRNAALKANAHQDELLIWNHEFSALGETLNAMRQSYLDEFMPFFNEMMGFLLKESSVTVNYSPGWDTKTSLATCLLNNVSRETLIRHTLYGPQRADIAIGVNGLSAQDVLSQGQQKLVSYALRLAQGLHLQSTTEKTPIYLIDDLPSELDHEKRKLVTEILSRIQTQTFITGVKSDDLEEILALDPENKMFHVKHGGVELTTLSYA